MRFYIILLILYSITTANTENSTNSTCLDLNDENANEILWKNLFIKLNTVLIENEKLSNNLREVNNRLNDLNKRLDAQDALIRQSFNQSQAWTTILRRVDASVNFYRDWNEYREGFGDPHGNFFIGLEKLHALTTYGPPQELLVVLKDYDNQTRYAKYSLFRVGSESEKYPLKELGAYRGDAGDALKHHIGHKFTTLDQDNDNNNERNCAVTFLGAWWFFGPCYSGHLNGPYRSKEGSGTSGISWDPWRGWNYSLKYAEMMIRPRT